LQAGSNLVVSTPSVTHAKAPRPKNYETIAKSGNFSVGVNTDAVGDKLAGLLISEKAAPDIATASADTNAAVLQYASEAGLTLQPVEVNLAYQNALLMHVLSPAQYRYHPQITTFCGNRPYALIAVIDYYSMYPSSLKIREKEKDAKINYFGRRSIIEEDKGLFAIKGNNNAVALEFFLVSTRTGNILWQANTITTKGAAIGFKGIAKGLVKNALKNLAKP
jgi:hypothetical protein